MPSDPVDVFSWRTGKLYGDIPFEWQGYEVDHDLGELVEHGLRGRWPDDDRPVTYREHKRLVAEEKRDLTIHTGSLKQTEPKPKRQRPKGQRQRKRGLLAAVRQMTPDEKAAMRRMWEGTP